LGLSHIDFFCLIGINIDVIPVKVVVGELKFNLDWRGAIGRVVDLEDVVAIWLIRAVLRVVVNCRFKRVSTRLRALNTQRSYFESSHEVFTIPGRVTGTWGGAKLVEQLHIRTKVLRIVGPNTESQRACLRFELVALVIKIDVVFLVNPEWEK
jgi:hypothetical protein